MGVRVQCRSRCRSDPGNYGGGGLKEEPGRSRSLPRPRRREVPLAPLQPKGPDVQPRAPRSPAHPCPGLWRPRTPRPGTYPGSVVAHHHLPALAVHRPPQGEPPPQPPPSHNLQPPPPGPCLFLLLPLRGPSYGLTFCPQPEVAARPRPPVRRRPPRKGRDRT